MEVKANNRNAVKQLARSGKTKCEKMWYCLWIVIWFLPASRGQLGLDRQQMLVGVGIQLLLTLAKLPKRLGSYQVIVIPGLRIIFVFTKSFYSNKIFNFHRKIAVTAATMRWSYVSPDMSLQIRLTWLDNCFS